MISTRLTVDCDFVISDLDRRIFGTFVEHMGRCVYTGIYEPGHPTADEKGYRRDVMDLTREMGVSPWEWWADVGSPAGSRDGHVVIVCERPFRKCALRLPVERQAYALYAL